MIRCFRDLHVYQRAFSASLEVHHLSKTFPAFEQRELGDQIRRATKSVAMNIAEGHGRNGSLPDFKRFMVIARGSCDEARVQLDYCMALRYISEEQYNKLESEYIAIGKMLTGLIKNWQKFSVTI